MAVWKNSHLAGLRKQGMLFQQIEEHVRNFFVEGVFPGTRHDDTVIHVVTELAGGTWRRGGAEDPR